MPKLESVHTYIGANTVRGQRSHRESLYDPGKTERVILIKGGAGNGKSTLMERVARAAEARGDIVERVHCPSDPESLDGIVCEKTSLVMLDATPPHVWEPGAHCLPEEYLSLSPYVSRDVQTRKAEILAINEELKAARAQADKCIRAAFEADSELACEVLTYADTGAMSKAGTELAKKYLTGFGREKQKYRPMKRRFISAIAPEGHSDFFGTPYALCGGGAVTVALKDELCISPFVLGAIAESAEKRGLLCWGFFDPLVPSRIVGLCIPEAGVCFLPSAGACDPAETVDTADFIPQKAGEELGARPHVLLSVKKALTDEARTRLTLCRRIHDRLEAEYRPFTDFKALDKLAEEIWCLTAP